MTVKLRKVADELEIIMEEYMAFFDRETYEVVRFPPGMYDDAEMGEPYEARIDWLEEDWEIANMVVQNKERFVELPSKWDIHDYEIIESFSYSIKDEQVRTQVLNAIRGRGAFRRFRKHIEYHGLLEDWYKYKSDWYAEIAREWCEENDIPYEE
ncbi:UPF0158 family protein [Halobacillus aidingensis]|uniref:Uncharacterized protein family (UPF0158) n=1 Tax=Halobacillus aidingensis TaxID=240303 RepID=A0A1H0ICU3_HALAD|nr:UPF0158 family protein [Halobacillus aidingensis]SDO28891.1 Uncharacterised protein family (UPF0158) [Halobacillus aidingensis]